MLLSDNGQILSINTPSSQAPPQEAPCYPTMSSCTSGLPSDQFQKQGQDGVRNLGCSAGFTAMIAGIGSTVLAVKSLNKFFKGWSKGLKGSLMGGLFILAGVASYMATLAAFSVVQRKRHNEQINTRAVSADITVTTFDYLIQGMSP